MRGKIICTLAGAAVGALIVLLLRPSGLSHPTASPAPTAAELALERTLPEVRFEFVPFDEAVQTLRRLSGTPINVDWPALKAAGFSPTTLVKLRGPGMTLEVALDYLLVPAEGQPPLGYTAESGSIVISTAGALERRPFVRTYDIRPLLGLDATAALPRPKLYLSSMTRLDPEEERVYEVMRLITDLVAADTWKDNGGSVGSITCYGGRLVVVQTWSNHRAIRRLLDQLSQPEPSPPTPRAGVYPRAAEADAKLRQVLPLVRMNGVPLGEAIDRLREQTGANLFVDWRALEAIDIDRKSPVEIDLHDVSFARALHFLLTSVATPAGRAGWGLDDGVIAVSTADATTGMTAVKVYDVRDLIESPKAATGPAGSSKPGPKTREDLFERLVRILTTDVAADSWEDNGGLSGSIHELNGRLVIQQTWENHQQIAATLDSLRDQASPNAPVPSATTRSTGVTP